MSKVKKKARKSRAIVAGYLEKVNSRIFGRYRKQITEMIRGNYGVYGIKWPAKLLTSMSSISDCV